VADGLDVEETPVGVEADLPERGQVDQPLADLEVGGVVDGRLGAQRGFPCGTAVSAHVLVKSPDG